MHPSLTIAIPTYNGSKYIETALDSIINEINTNNLNCVNILVINNASSDNTEKIVQDKLSSTNIPSTYIRNQSNIGYDRNILEIFNEASGDYLWIIGDDDALEIGSILKILNILELNPKIGVIQVNFNHYDRNLESIVDVVPMSMDKTFHSADEFLLCAQGRYSLVSSLILKMKFLKTNNFNWAIGKNFIHVYAMMKLLMLGDSFIVASPLVKFRTGSTVTGTSGDSIIKICIDFGDLVNQLKNIGYAKSTIKNLKINSKNYAYQSIIPAINAGIENKFEIIRLLAKTFNGPTLWIKWVPFILIPKSIFIPAYNLKKIISKRTKFLEIGLKSAFKIR